MIITSIINHTRINTMFVFDLLSKLSNSTTIALKQSDNSLTYGELYEKSKSLSQHLSNSISEESLTVALCLPNSINYAVAYFGVLFSKRVIVPIGTQAKELEILSTIEYCEADMIITDLTHKEFICNCLEHYCKKIFLCIIETSEIILIHENIDFVKKSNYLIQTGNEDDVAIMLHTSGTTSNPKRVMLTHKNLISNVKSNVASLNLTVDDRVLIALPMFFGYCNTAQFLTHIYLGASMVILDSVFLPKQFFQIVEKEKITNFTGVPSMLLMLLDYRYSDNYDFGSLRYICFGGGKMPVEKLKKLIEKYPSIGFVQTYGQTECSPRATALLPDDSIRKMGSVGKPIPDVNVQVFDENDNPVPHNKIGEIVVNGNNTMKGYYKQPEISKETKRNGWLHTGDLGYFDGEGYLYLTGRLKNIIISGGINIYPEEIEQLLLQHECVDDICVFGEEHEMMGEVPVAKIVLKSDISTVELRKFCSENLANYKVPVRFDIVNSLPKTYNGKTKRC
ncbi:class I adenylate-forming enzyme family protein [Anaerocolumna jejuensis]|uniref:class I adenylate-forming enzyme family protein n=1 Tax=Anaerocolumna jejuensis TaxID=259063 RepID=UPI003F7C2B3E